MTIKKISAQSQIAAPATKKADLLSSQKPTLTSDEVSAVDRLCELEIELAPIRAKLKEYEEKKKYLASVALLKYPAEEVAVLAGTKGRVEFSVETHSREIKDMHGLIGAMKTAVGGYEKLLPVLKINLGDVDKVLSEAERKPFIGDAEEGSRKIKGVYPE